MTPLEVQQAYQNKIKVMAHFKLVPFALVLLTDAIYEEGYMPVVDVQGKLGWVYEKPRLMDPTKLETVCGPQAIEVVRGFGGVEQTLRQIEFNPHVSFVLLTPNDSMVTVDQYVTGKQEGLVAKVIGRYQHHKFLI